MYHKLHGTHRSTQRDDTATSNALGSHTFSTGDSAVEAGSTGCFREVQGDTDEGYNTFQQSASYSRQTVRLNRRLGDARFPLQRIPFISGSEFPSLIELPGIFQRPYTDALHGLPQHSLGNDTSSSSSNGSMSYERTPGTGESNAPTPVSLPHAIPTCSADVEQVSRPPAPAREKPRIAYLDERTSLDPTGSIPQGILRMSSRLTSIPQEAEVQAHPAEETEAQNPRRNWRRAWCKPAVIVALLSLLLTLIGIIIAILSLVGKSTRYSES